VQALARRQLASADGSRASAVFGGVKLATGSIHATNSDGSRAGRALQQWTGTSDVILGGAGRRVFGMNSALIGQASLSPALNSMEDFKLRQHIELSVGWSHAYSHSLGTVLQFNARHRGRANGLQAEPDKSGSTTVELSPGVTLGVGSASTLCADVQVPVYQKVNGIQLIPRNALAVGWTSDF